MTRERVEAFLPSNYAIIFDGTAYGDDYIDIEGHDNAGWTLDDYVLPRLATGCLFGREILVY